MTVIMIILMKDGSVEIEGEAYFEVAKDEGKPFHVLANGSDLSILGRFL